MKYRIKKLKDGFAVQKGFLIYITHLRGFPTEGDAQSWINLNG